MQTILITGASSGLGKATAKLFSAKGWRVIATMRNPEAEQELSQLPDVILKALDITDPGQIQSLAAETHDIDVVFNNAGYGMIGPLEALTDEQLSRQFETNVLGVIRLTRAFIPYFREQRKGLFITTTSIAGLIGLPLNSIYCATKWAMEGWTEALSYELNQFGIGVKTVAPGGIKTDFTGRSLATTSHPAYGELSAKLYAGFDPETFTAAEDIALTVYEAATDGKNQLRYLAGEDAKATYAHRLAVGNEVFRQETANMY
jgi:NAD(P)-dependent dehydrogenase (short-subunit alcohol dehydrogenase family)